MLNDMKLEQELVAFLVAFCLRVTPDGWGFCTFPVLTSSRMARLLRFSDQLSDAIARP